MMALRPWYVVVVASEHDKLLGLAGLLCEEFTDLCYRLSPLVFKLVLRRKEQALLRDGMFYFVLLALVAHILNGLQHRMVLCRVWAPFGNPARSDNQEFYHWVKVS